jgi:hypothetical protein
VGVLLWGNKQTSRLLQEVPSAVITLLPYVLPVITERMPLDIPLTPASDNDYLKEPVGN